MRAGNWTGKSRSGCQVIGNRRAVESPPTGVRCNRGTMKQRGAEKSAAPPESHASVRGLCNRLQGGGGCRPATVPPFFATALHGARTTWGLRMFRVKDAEVDRKVSLTGRAIELTL